MKIDPRISFQGDAQADLVKKTNGQADASQSRSKSEGVSSPSSEDTFTLSSSLSEAQRHQATLANVPEIRADRVHALQQKVQSSTYNPDSQKIAEALVAEHVGLSVKA
jgi:flagellar biosynthesis anti-sigma factor FlgM